MIISESSDHDSPEKRQNIFQDINVYLMIPQAKPVISPTRKYANEKNGLYLFNTSQVNLRKKKTLFRKEATIESGLNFSSYFQSGNIQQVNQIQQNHYYLKVRPDTNSKHQSQWFYFKVKGIKKAKFIVYGFKKSKSLYNNGMKICIKQDKWKRAGSNICYYKEGQGYAVKFDYVFKNPQQITQIAYCYPYSYTDLKQYLTNIITNKFFKKIVRTQIIGHTFLNNQINCLTLTEPSQLHNKPIILISSRVHPGETVSSYVLKGLIDFLLTDSKSIKALLKKFQIKIIPMLNPDGVKLGNYRFSYTGRDLNRQWHNPSMKMSPQICQVRAYIEKYSNRICMIIDLHGHSRKKDVFFYGCDNQQNNYQVRKFPYMMSKICQFYSYSKCNFSVQKSKQGTARIHLWKSLKIPFIYTLQTSFCGNQKSSKNYDIYDLQLIGSKLIEGIIIFYSEHLIQECPQQFQNKQKIILQFQTEKQNLKIQNSQEGSDSQPSQGKLEQTEVLNIIQQIKKRKTMNDIREKYTIKKSETPQTKFTKPVRNFRKRVSASLKNTKPTLKIQTQFIGHPFHQKESQIQLKRKNDKLYEQLIEREKKQFILNQIQNKNAHNLQFLNYFNNRQNPSVAKFLADDYQKHYGQEYPDFGFNTEQSTIKSSSNNPNFGAQYIRVKNYAQKLKQQTLKVKSKVNIGQIGQNQYQKIGPCTTRKQLKDLKLHITPVKLQKHPELGTQFGKAVYNYSHLKK